METFGTMGAERDDRRIVKNEFVKVPHRFGDYDYKVETLHRDGSVTVSCVTPGLVGLLSRVEKRQCVSLNL